MTIQEVLAEVDEIKPNTYDDSIKIKWLSELDGKIKTEIIDKHVSDESEISTLDDDADSTEDATEDTSNVFTGYTAYDMQKDLLVEFPYTDLYRHYLFAMIDYSNGETDRYQNSMIMFNSAYQSFSKWYNSTHLPIQNNLKLF